MFIELTTVTNDNKVLFNKNHIISVTLSIDKYKETMIYHNVNNKDLKYTRVLESYEEVKKLLGEK